MRGGSIHHLVILLQQAFDGLVVQTLECAAGGLVLQLDGIVLQTPLAMGIFEGDGVVDEFEEVCDGGFVGYGDTEKDADVRKAVAADHQAKAEGSVHHWRGFRVVHCSL